MNFRIAIVVGVCSTFVVGNSCLGQGSPNSPANVEGLKSSDMAARVSALNRIRSEQKALVRGLISLLEGARADDGSVHDELDLKNVAIMLLGELRASEAIPVLIQNLGYKVRVSAGSTGANSSPLNTNPAVRALIQIGSPSLRQAWSRVDASDDPVERELCIFIIGQIQGEEVTRLLLDRKIEKANSLRKPRYEAARAAMGKYAFPTP